jgi:hypothetical protein
MLGIACAKFGVTLSPTSCAEEGVAVAMATDAAPMTVRIFMALLSLE